MRGGAEPPTMEQGDLAVHIEGESGTSGEQDRVLVLAHAADGVRVREWNASNWSTGPDERTMSAAAVLEMLEHATRRRRRIRPDLPHVRAWLMRSTSG